MNIANRLSTSRLMVWACMASVIVFLWWADWAELDQITRANGQVITTSRNQVIQASDGGVLSVLNVKEGDKVSKGQVLARFERTKVEAAFLESVAKAAALKATVARLRAEIFGGEPKFPAEIASYAEFKANQLALFTKRQTAINEDVQALEQVESLIKQELEMNLPLLDKGDVSRTDVLRLQRQLVDVRSQITGKKSKYLQDSQADLVKAEEDLEGIQQVVTQRKNQLDVTEIISPMDGIVRNVRLTTLGGVARAGDEIMQIVPIDEALIVEAKVKPGDIAFIKKGMPATVKFDAYDYSIYGVLRGDVSYISADTIAETIQGVEQPYYRVQIKTSSESLAGVVKDSIRIQPGMTASIEVATGKRTVLNYLSKPITKTLDESLGEK